MKQSLSMLVFLLFLLSVSITVVAQDFESLLEKAKNAVTAKSPILELVSKKQERENEVVYQWNSSEGGVRLLVFFGASLQEATEKMRFSARRSLRYGYSAVEFSRCHSRFARGLIPSDC